VEGGVSGTTITDGLLAVDYAATLTVRAASTVGTSKSGEAAIVVIPAIPRTITIIGLDTAYNGKTFAVSLSTSCYARTLLSPR
jgi:hypothetical protein